MQAPKTKDKDGDEATQKKVKEAQKEELDRQNRAQTNQALGAALGGGARWQKFHARVKPAGGSGASPVTCPALCTFPHYEHLLGACCPPLYISCIMPLQ